MCTIIVKSLRTFITDSTVEYFKYEIINGEVIETELGTKEALDLIKDMQELHRLDHNNVIWGDPEFKTKCPEYFKLKIGYKCPKELIVDGINIKYNTYDIIIKEDNIIMSNIKKYLDNQFSLLYQHLNAPCKSDHKKIYFDDYIFNYYKFNQYQKLLIRLYENKSMNLKKFYNNDLDLLLFVLNEFDICQDLANDINDEIEFRINKGIYEA